jgi:membrane protein YqaA with SNARE-associated domain
VKPSEDTPSLRPLLLRALGGILVAGAIVGVIGRVYRGQLEGFARAFVERFGYIGMGLGTFVADAFTVPIPSWFYFVLAVASRASPAHAIVAVTIGSLVAACLAYLLSAWFVELPFLRARMAKVRERIAPMLAQHGYKAVVVISLLPLPFSITCYAFGSQRASARIFGAYLFLRIPRLLAFYALVRLGWSA